MKKIFWVGDSTVAYNTIDTYPQTGMGQVFGLYCKREYEVFDYGKNGASSKSFYDSGRFVPVEENIGEQDFLFIQFGHNDEKPKPDRYTEPYSTYQQYLMRYANTARQKGAYPVLITPLSRRLFEQEGSLKDSHTDYPKAMLDLGLAENIPCIDLCESSKQLLLSKGELESRKWFMYFPEGTYSNYHKDMIDNTHLHYEGAVVMAGLVADGVRNLHGVYEEMLLPVAKQQ
jgi:lysophospholipase L1-like esterase